MSRLASPETCFLVASKDAEVFVSSLNESLSVHAGLVHSYSTSKTLLLKDQNDKSSIFIEKDLERRYLKAPIGNLFFLIRKHI